MTMVRTLVFGVVVLVGAVAAFGSSDDKFIKKYAMMKIYESCFGPEVVKEIRREMKAACAKCAALSGGERPILAVGGGNPYQQPQQMPPLRIPQYGGKYGELAGDQQQPQMPLTNDMAGQLGPIVHLGQLPQHQQDPQQQLFQQHMQHQHQQQQPDLEKIQQALAAFYAQQQAQQQFVSPFAYRYQPVPYNNPWMQPVQNPFPYFQPQFYRNRMSRDMDLRNKLEVLTARSSGKVRNVTCVMQELGYLDENLEPNFEKIAERIENLPVSNELKQDMQDGLQFCQKFSNCVPETKRDNSPLSKELIKPMFFFRCYKHKKLEACVMKDVRERFSSEDDLETDSDFRSISSRVGKSTKFDDSGSGNKEEAVDEIEDLAGSIYDYLYGRAELDMETLL